MTKAATVAARYVFVDVVAFSRNRSVEAQADIISTLNVIVREALGDAGIDEGSSLLLPTGDGICIAIKSIDDPFDLHVVVALSILQRLDEYNEHELDARRRFEVRLGVNANIDNVVTDIRGNENIAGQGINLAQRIMSMADGNQVMVGQAVFEVLSQREKYDKAFRCYEAVVKHGLRLPVYQLVAEGHRGLNVAEPSRFTTESFREPKLTRTVAYYIALAIQHEHLLRTCVGLGQSRLAGIAFLYFSALEAESVLTASDPRLVFHREPAGVDTPPEQRYRYYFNLDFDLVCGLSSLVIDHVLEPYAHLFERHEMDYWFVNEEGRARLHTDWPAIEAQLCTTEPKPEEDGNA